MKYRLEENPPGSPRTHTLMRYGEPAGSATPEPGAYDNAHYEFWCEIERLRNALQPFAALYPEVADRADGARLTLTCGPTCGCGKTFEAEPGKPATCPHCGKGWGPVPVIG